MEGKSFAGGQYDRALLQLGVLLFLIGLLTGFAVPAAAIPRMALSSHLEGLFNGIVLVVLGLMWHRLVLPAWAIYPRQKCNNVEIEPEGHPEQKRWL